MSKSKTISMKRLENENVLQAVVIVDTFSHKLIPFTDYMPSSLIPLANRPLLDYTLDCLFSSGVQEAIIFCSSFADQIKYFIRKERWPGLAISIIVSEGCRSLGDVMRDLDTKALIRNDFILVTGSLVGNLQLLPALETHKRIQKTDKGAVMTLIFKECGKRWKAPEDEFTVATDSKTNRVVLYSKKSRNVGKIYLPMETVLETSEIDLRCDLLDTQVCMCSMAVPPLFSDNFDFQSKDDFVRGLLFDEEVISSSIYAYTLPSEQYAASVETWAHYQDVTHDVIHRWVYPMVPDLVPNDPYLFRRNNIYTQRDINLSQACKLVEDVVVGSGTSVRQNTTVTRSVIGRNCQIGSNVVIDSSYIMDNTTIQDDCLVSYSVIGPGCVIQSGAKVTGGSALATGVVIDAGKTISNLRLQSNPPPDGDLVEAVCSKAYLYQSTVNGDEDSDSDLESGPDMTTYGLRVPGQTDNVEYWETSSESDDELTHSLSPTPDDTNLFYCEVVDSLVRGFDDKLNCDNLVLEINSSRYAYNVTMSEVNFHVTRALLTLPQPDGRAWPQLASRLAYFTPILTNYIRSETAQRDCLLAIEDVAGSHPEVFECVVKVIHWLYEKDILSEEVILKWYNNPSPETEPCSATRLRKQVSPFIKWLKEAEVCSDSDDD